VPPKTPLLLSRVLSGVIASKGGVLDFVFSEFETRGFGLNVLSGAPLEGSSHFPFDASQGCTVSLRWTVAIETRLLMEG
jgi:hypothetical protein